MLVNEASVHRCIWRPGGRITFSEQIWWWVYTDANAYFRQQCISFISFASIYLFQINKHAGNIIMYYAEIFVTGFVSSDRRYFTSESIRVCSTKYRLASLCTFAAHERSLLSYICALFRGGIQNKQSQNSQCKLHQRMHIHTSSYKNTRHPPDHRI